MRLLAGLLAALLVSGCCTSTWFRSCGPERAAVPVPLSSSASAGEHRGEFSFSWVVTREGELSVTVKDLPAGRWRVEARRPGGPVVGSIEITVPNGHGLTNITIWPARGKSFPGALYPVFARANGPSSLLTGGGQQDPLPLFSLSRVYVSVAPYEVSALSRSLSATEENVMRTILLIAAVSLVLLLPPLHADEIFYLGAPLSGGQCRLLDTRNLGDPILNGTTFSFKARGQQGHLQGGDQDCGAPVHASGVMLNVIVIPTTNSGGWLSVFTFGGPPSSRVNYGLANLPIANEILVRLLQPIVTTSEEVSFRPAVSPAHVVIDLVAYTAEPNPSFAPVKGRVSGAPFQVDGFTHIRVETAAGGDCSDSDSCIEIRCSNQPGAGEVCLVLDEDRCVEVLGYQRPTFFELEERLIGTIVLPNAAPTSDPCPWEE